MDACLLDTGPIVALLDRSEPDHNLISRFMPKLAGYRLFTTAAIVTEAFYFLSQIRNGPRTLAAFLAGSEIEIYDVFDSLALIEIALQMDKYMDVPMDFPDATLVWVAGQTGTSKILTLDRRGFSTFRHAQKRKFKLVLDLAS